MPIIKRMDLNVKYNAYKDIKTVGFQDTVDYILGKDGKHDPKHITNITYRNIADPELAIEIMESIASTYTGQETQVKGHYVISYNKNEELTKEQIDSAVERALKILGLQNACAVYATHEDTDHLHVHICACRVDAITSRILNSKKETGKGFVYRALEHLGMEICLEEGRCPPQNGKFLIKDGEIVDNPNYHKKPHLSQRARDMEYWNKKLGITKNKKGEKVNKSLESIAIERVGNILETSTSWPTLHKNLANAGLKLIKTGKSGLSIALSENPKHRVRMRIINSKKTLKQLEKEYDAPYRPAPPDLEIKWKPLAENLITSFFKKNEKENKIITVPDYLLQTLHEKLARAKTDKERKRMQFNHSFYMKAILNSPYSNQEYNPKTWNTVRNYINEKVEIQTAENEKRIQEYEAQQRLEEQRKQEDAERAQKAQAEERERKEKEARRALLASVKEGDILEITLADKNKKSEPVRYSFVQLKEGTITLNTGTYHISSPVDRFNYKKIDKEQTRLQEYEEQKETETMAVQEGELIECFRRDEKRPPIRGYLETVKGDTVFMKVNGYVIPFSMNDHYFEKVELMPEEKKRIKEYETREAERRYAQQYDQFRVGEEVVFRYDNDNAIVRGTVTAIDKDWCYIQAKNGEEKVCSLKHGTIEKAVKTQGQEKEQGQYWGR